MDTVRRLIHLEELTGVDTLPDYEGMWAVGAIPGNAWARTFGFAAKKVKPSKRLTSNEDTFQSTAKHSGYTAVMNAAFRVNEDKPWLITVFSDHLRCTMTLGLTAFHESAHLIHGFSGSKLDEERCDSFAISEMTKLFGKRITQEVERRRAAGRTCWSIPGLQEAAERLRDHDLYGVREFGLLLELQLAQRAKSKQKPKPRFDWGMEDHIHELAGELADALIEAGVLP